MTRTVFIVMEHPHKVLFINIIQAHCKYSKMLLKFVMFEGSYFDFHTLYVT